LSVEAKSLPCAPTSITHGNVWRTLVTQKIQAPLYRIPDSTFASGLPKLIGDGRLGENEIAVLLEYADKVSEINRGLDRAGAAHLAQPGGIDSP
jgi:hypothetical protein